MKLTEKNCEELLQIAVSAATEAGLYISSYDRSILQVDQKSTGHTLASKVVTEVDKASQHIILEHLRPTLHRFDLALLSEEHPDDRSRLLKDYFWCIDPLDGTLPFIEGLNGYAVSIALVERSGMPVIGVVYDPVNNAIYQSAKGLGAFKNGKNIASVNDDTFLLVADKSIAARTAFPAIREQLFRQAIENGFPKFEYRSHGGAVMNALWITEHASGCFFKLPKPEQGSGSMWDYAATTCIFNELKMHVSDISGRDLHLNNSDTLFMNHCGVLYASHSDLAEKVITAIKQHH